jgi:hypothetical protein
MSLKIKQAALHETIHVPQYGQIRKELSSVTTATNKGTNMTLLENGLVQLELEGAQRQKVTILVPATNFQYLLAEADPKPLPLPFQD